MSKNLHKLKVPVYIHAKLNDYCYNCQMADLYFEKDAAYAGNEKFVAIHTIKCRNEKLCEQIKENLERIAKDDTTEN